MRGAIAALALTAALGASTLAASTWGQNQADRADAAEAYAAWVICVTQESDGSDAGMFACDAAHGAHRMP